MREAVGVWASLARKFSAWFPWSFRSREPDHPLPLIAPPPAAPLTDWTPAQVPPVVEGEVVLVDGEKVPAGSFVHFEDILEAIPECRRLIRKMRKVDKDAYEYHSRVGARVLSERVLLERDYIRQEFIDALPAKGMIYTPAKYDTDDSVVPRFIYFDKVKAQPDYCGIPAASLAIYRVGCAFLELTKGKDKPMRSGYVEFLVSVQPDRTAVLLKERLREKIRTPHCGHYKVKPIGNGGGGRNRWSRNKAFLPRGKEFFRSYSGYDPFLDTWAQDRIERKGGQITANDVASALFRFPASEYASSACEDFQVRAERGGVSVAFSVAIGRTPYFFKDRQTEVTTDGKRRRIFHAVVGHTRVLKSGKVSTVKAHYRGERSFVWHDEKITITKPENSIARFDVPAIEVYEDQAVNFEVMPAGELAQVIRDRLEAA